MRNKTYTLKSGDVLCAYVDGEEKFSFTHGLRVKTDLNGEIISVYGISETEIDAKVIIKEKEYNAVIKPNEEYEISNGELKLKNKVPFNN